MFTFICKDRNISSTYEEISSKPAGALVKVAQEKSEMLRETVGIVHPGDIEL